MNNVRRFNLLHAQPGDVQEAPHGKFVGADDFQALLDENAALRQRNESLEAQAAHNYEVAQLAIQEVTDFRAIVHPGGPEQDAFECAYAAEMSKATGQPAGAESVELLRHGEGYRGDLDHLNGQWRGWQARSNLLPKASVKAVEAAKARMERIEQLLHAVGPTQAIGDQALPETDLLAVARSTGLRGFIHGVNASDTRQLLRAFVAALPAESDGRGLRDFFKCCKRIGTELADSPKSALTRLQQAIADVEAIQGRAHAV